jgi:hypothetical protein
VSSKLTKRANAGRAPQREHPHDRYDTHPCAVHALLKVERLPRRIWEPACGKGNIVRVLRKAGHYVVATDIRKRGCPDAFKFDFTDPRMPLACETDCIVTNPPYSLAEIFVRNALEHVPKVAMLLRLAFLESVRRAPLLDTGMLARVHVFANRLPMMHREGWTGKRASSAIAFAWFIWDRNHSGPTLIDRIKWTEEEPTYGRKRFAEVEKERRTATRLRWV